MPIRSNRTGARPSYVDRILKGEKPQTCRCRRRPSTASTAKNFSRCNEMALSSDKATP
jgi:hypothetical protein